MRYFFLAVILSTVVLAQDNRVFRAKRTVASATPGQCGNTNVESTTDYPSSGYLLSGPTCVPSSNATVEACKIYTVATTSYKIACAVYDSDGGSGRPGTPICQNSTGVTTQAATWVSIPLTGCGTLTSGHTYWISWKVENAAAGVKYTGSGPWYYNSQAWGTFLSYTGWSSIARTYSMYLSVLY